LYSPRSLFYIRTTPLSSAAGFTVRADFAGGEVSSDLGALILSTLDRRIGLIDRMTGAIADSRHASGVTYPLRVLMTQHIFQIASCYEDVNAANTCAATSCSSSPLEGHLWMETICWLVVPLSHA
jgi:hypothetical protein